MSTRHHPFSSPASKALPGLAAVLACGWIAGCGGSDPAPFVDTGAQETLEFEAQAVVALDGSSPTSLAVEDLDGDGDLDFVVSNGDLEVGVGRTRNLVPDDGNPNTERIFVAGCVVDLLGPTGSDGPDENSISLVENALDSGGGFRLYGSSPIAVGRDPQDVAAGLIDGDALPDIVTANAGEDTITLLRNLGGGNFAEFGSSPIAVGVLPHSVAIGELNSAAFEPGEVDRADIAVGNKMCFDTYIPSLQPPPASNQNVLFDPGLLSNVTVLQGDGSGGFTEFTGSPFKLRDPTKPESVPTPHLKSNGSRQAAEDAAKAARGDFPRDLAIADLDDNGFPDIVTANRGSGDVSIVSGRAGRIAGGADFSIRPVMPTGAGDGAVAVDVGDVDGDDVLDIVTANSLVDTVAPLQGNGLGGVAAFDFGTVGVGEGPSHIDLADMDGDGNPDFVVATLNGVGVFLGDGNGGFVQNVVVGGEALLVAAQDVDDDGDTDIVAVSSDGELSVFLQAP